ncbi:3D domain-containing protein [Adhaeribacter terreus]|uniref:3D domain-containing protein n=1 Tax=Adhaeribacter terreus TaxID=529703 RepID=A0ABW0EAV8_9BACT
MPSRFLILIVLVLVQAKAFPQTSPGAFDLAPPANPSALRKLNLWATYYFVHQFKSGGNIPIVYRNGKPSGLYADACDFCEASLQGSAYVTDAEGNVSVVKFAKTGKRTFVNCRTCTKFSDSNAAASWGKALWIKSTGFSGGLNRYKLIPFRSVAVDRKVIPYGTVLYIPQFQGQPIALPNGQTLTHDGYFFAADRGGLVKKNQIDLFTGTHSTNPFPEIIRSDNNQTFEAYIVKDKAIINALKAAHRK